MPAHWVPLASVLSVSASAAAPTMTGSASLVGNSATSQVRVTGALGVTGPVDRGDRERMRRRRRAGSRAARGSVQGLKPPPSSWHWNVDSSFAAKEKLGVLRVETPRGPRVIAQSGRDVVVGKESRFGALVASLIASRCSSPLPPAVREAFGSQLFEPASACIAPVQSRPATGLPVPAGEIRIAQGRRDWRSGSVASYGKRDIDRRFGCRR